MDVLKRRRISQLNQSDFWGRVNVKQSGGSRYESGRNLPAPVATLLTMAYGTDKQARQLFADLRRK